MRKIKLTQGLRSLVDDEDYVWLNQWKWHYLKSASDNTGGYAARRIPYKINKERPVVMMHAEIMKPPDGFEADHINGNGLDNQRINLRLCTRQQNSMNRAMAADNKSGYKGVSCAREDQHLKKPWRAFIQANGKRKQLGRFFTPEEAALAYDEAAIEHYGEFARTNKMMGLLY